MDLGLKNKVAVITGGSVGIGLAVAKGFAAEGAHIAITARNAERLEAARAEITKAGAARVITVSSDLATPEGVATVVAAVEREFGGADILLNNAGTGSNETIMDAPDDAVVTALGLSLGKSGNVRTQTLRAFSRADMDAVLGKVA